jgi:hypothetical protein
LSINPCQPPKESASWQQAQQAQSTKQDGEAKT